MGRRVVRKNSTNVSGDRIASIFTVEEYAKKRKKENQQAERNVGVIPQNYKAL
jgi:hypothetical protein